MKGRPEVLSPAGDMERFLAAVEYGADAVYLAGPSFGMRAGTSNFTREELAEAVRTAHERGVKVYVTVNTIPTDEETERLPEYLSFLDGIGTDALIVADIGVLSLCRRYAPHCAVHISTQAGVMNAETARAFHELGASRVVLAREMSMEDVKRIVSRLPEGLEAEVFVHGAMCVSFSGRCVLSNYLAGRDANRGQCAQPCRWKYYLMEEKRPGEHLEILEDKGTYLFNSRDMCMIDHVGELAEAGVSALKIEGRTKSAYYTASVTAAYRHAVDAAAAGEELPRIWRDEVNKTSHRPYSTGFYYGEPGQHTDDSLYVSDCDVAALVEQCGGDGWCTLRQRNRFRPGDELEILRPDGDPLTFTVGELTDGEGNRVEVANRADQVLRTRLPVRVPAHSFLRRRRQDG